MVMYRDTSGVSIPHFYQIAWLKPRKGTTFFDNTRLFFAQSQDAEQVIDDSLFLKTIHR